MPDAVHTLSYNLYPLLSGLVALPQLKLTPTESSIDLKANQLTELLERSLPTHIYVMVKLKKIGIIWELNDCFVLQPRAKGKSENVS
jgi:hypothetical protein